MMINRSKAGITVPKEGYLKTPVLGEVFSSLVPLRLKLSASVPDLGTVIPALLRLLGKKVTKLETIPSRVLKIDRIMEKNSV